MCGVRVVRSKARCLPSEEKMYGCKYVRDRSSVLSREFGSVRSSEVQMYNYNGISNGDNVTVRSRGGVLSWEKPLHG